MEFIDKNQTLVPPEGFTVVDVESDGAYIKVWYVQIVPTGQTQVIIYLNDMGREVGRSSLWTAIPQPAAPSPKRWWETLIQFSRRTTCRKP